MNEFSDALSKHTGQNSPGLFTGSKLPSLHTVEEENVQRLRKCRRLMQQDAAKATTEVSSSILDCNLN